MKNDIFCVGLTRTELQTFYQLHSGSSLFHSLDEELQKLFALTACTFEALQTRCDVRRPEELAKLYAAELCE